MQTSHTMTRRKRLQQQVSAGFLHRSNAAQKLKLASTVLSRVDEEWHHVAVTWRHDSGETQLYFDGARQTPFWRSESGVLDIRDPAEGGVSALMAARTTRAPEGAPAWPCL